MLGIFIDLSKAFDTIDHGNLLVKLDRYGIRGNANCLIKSYLSNRVQYTEIHDEKSDPLTIKYGVPQGSVLGPLLFLLYTIGLKTTLILRKFHLSYLIRNDAGAGFQTSIIHLDLRDVNRC